MFKKILIPLDRSPLAEQAIGQAMTIARGSAAHVNLVLVHDAIAFDGYASAHWDEAERNQEDLYLATIADEIRSGGNIRVATELVRGAPAETIARRAKETAPDLIVMTSHGRTGLSRMWLGSVADSVIRHAEVPVLVLRPKETAGPRTAAGKPLTHILIPTDGSALANTILRPALNLAKATGAEVTLLQIVHPVGRSLPIEPFAPDAYLLNTPDEEATNERVLEESAKLDALTFSLRETEHLAVRGSAIVSNNIAKAILDFADGHGVDAIAMATHGRGVSRYLLGSVTDKVLRSTSVPVLVQRPSKVARRDENVADFALTNASTL